MTGDDTGIAAVFLSADGARRAQFLAAARDDIRRLYLAEHPAGATRWLAESAVDVVVVDLERFERSIDLPALGALVQAAGPGTRVLLVCPYLLASWLPALAAFGPVDYVIGPLADADLVAQACAPRTAPSSADHLRTLLAAHWAMQRAVADVDDPAGMAARICAVFARYPGALHAALFELGAGGAVQALAQAGLAQEPAVLRDGQRYAGLMAAGAGELTLLDAPEKAGDPELAMDLLTQDVHMVLTLPVRVPGGALRGVACVLFGARFNFTVDDFAAFTGLAELAGCGLRSAEMAHETEQLAGQLTQLATTDPLTGAANRLHGESLLDQEARRARRYEAPLALVSFDVDRFRTVNDQFGHPCGDLALRTIADLARSVLRSSDRLVRSGGQEFTVIAPHANAIEGLRIAEKIRAAIAGAVFAGCDRLTISAGVGQLTGDESPDRLTVRVQGALTRAKRAGRNCVELAMP
jgi:diguanylate cyclase (GGDEF)-like protein